MNCTLKILVFTIAIGLTTCSDDSPLKSSIKIHSQRQRNVNTAEDRDSTKCHFYNASSCEKSGQNCNGTEICEVEAFREAQCYALWSNVNGTIKVTFKGCWKGTPAECSGERCVERRKNAKKNLYFCCCKGELCNADMLHDPTVEEFMTTDEIDTVAVEARNIVNSYTFVAASIFLALVLLVFLTWYYRYRKTCDFNELPTSDSIAISESQTPFIPFKPINLLEVKAQGRFGSVWKGSFVRNDTTEQLVAVKIFPTTDKSSWIQEREIYQLPQMRHENILCFLGAERHARDQTPFNCEYWLITEYLEEGSLCDYLKTHVVSYEDLIKIAEGMARGLTHLHEELPASRTEKLKPTVAHRDFKSKNVLLKPDLTACVADFGLALVFHPNEPQNESLGQVGTRRYMAPEVLEGAICFSRDALLRIDMYACGLVLWELMSRCSAQDGPIGNYQLPFEEEIGPHPGLEDMQDVVCQQKKRPELKENWRRHPGLKIISETIEECWDQDAEARLSASCVEERVNSLKISGQMVANYLHIIGPNNQTETCRNNINAPLLVKETST
ncbi:Activin receptor type-2A [Halotydeus destructor]|nr:Activin receptor type-2A [Halotydeus destructor]